MFYWACFLAAAAVTAAMKYTSMQKQAAEAAAGRGGGAGGALKSPEFIRFQRLYLFVYLCAMFADWLKGPYVCALYESYGYEKGQISALFVGGFLVSAVSGPFAGAIADKFGRRACASPSTSSTCTSPPRSPNRCVVDEEGGGGVSGRTGIGSVGGCVGGCVRISMWS